MIITLSGVTGVGKSYLKKKIIQQLNLKSLIVVTTRKKREGEIDGIDKYFLSKSEYDTKKERGEISVTFNFLGADYAYYTSELKSKENSITELHYTTINSFKNVAENVLSIYLVPSKVEFAIEQLKKRNLPAEVENKRIEEIKEQIEIANNNQNIMEQFDYVIENDYTNKVVDEVINIIKKNIAIKA